MSHAIIDLEALAELPAQLTRVEQHQLRIITLLEQRHNDDGSQIGGIAELAEWLSLSKSAAKSLVHREEGLAHLASRTGTARRWIKRDVISWIEQRRVRSMPQLRAVGGAK